MKYPPKWFPLYPLVLLRDCVVLGMKRGRLSEASDEHCNDEARNSRGLLNRNVLFIYIT